MDLTLTRAPAGYSESIAKQICDKVADGAALLTVCDMPGMPNRGQVYYWRRTMPAFKAQLHEAMEAHADALFDELVPIADTEMDPQKARNRIEARKARAASIKPKEYGPRVDLNVTTQVDYTAAHADAKERLRLMRDLPQTLVPQVVDGVPVFAPCATDNESDDAPVPPVSPSIFD